MSDLCRFFAAIALRFAFSVSAYADAHAGRLNSLDISEIIMPDGVGSGAPEGPMTLQSISSSLKEVRHLRFSLPQSNIFICMPMGFRR